MALTSMRKLQAILKALEGVQGPRVAMQPSAGGQRALVTHLQVSFGKQTCPGAEESSSCTHTGENRCIAS